MVQQTTTTWRWWWWRAAAMMMVILMDTGNRWWSMWCEKRWPLLVTRYGGRLLYLRYCFVRGAAHIEPFLTTHTNSDSHPILPANVDMIWVSEQCKTFPLWPSESCCRPCSARPRTKIGVMLPKCVTSWMLDGDLIIIRRNSVQINE